MVKKLPVLFFALLLLVHGAVAQGELRLLVRGQEIPLDHMIMNNDVPLIAVDERGFPRIAELLGGAAVWDENAMQLTVTTEHPHAVNALDKAAALKKNGTWYFPLSKLAKAFNASLEFDSAKNIWYINPWIEQVSLQSLPDKTAVEVESSTPIQPTVARLSNPPRIILDFPYANLPSGLTQTLPDTTEMVKQVEVGQFQTKPGIVRVTLQLADENVQWGTGTQDQGGKFSVVLSHAPNPADVNLETSQGPAALGKVELKNPTDAPADSVAAELQLSTPASFAWKKLKAPDNRIYIDFLNCTLGEANTVTADNPLFEEIRVAQFQQTPVPIVRVVFQLKNSYHTNIESTLEGIRVTITPQIEESDEALTGGGLTGSTSKVAAKGKDENRFHPKVSANGIVVVLDPGHGGSDPGARGRNLVEKEITLDIADRLQNKLTEDGFTVIMTRTSDRDVLGYHGSAKAELQSRVDVAEQSNAAMFISLHINSSFASWPHGIQTHWYKGVDLPLANSIERAVGASSGFTDRGILRDRFYVLHHSTMPSVLVEMGFISNSGDENLLSRPDERERLAEALAQGVVEYTQSERNARTNY